MSDLQLPPTESPQPTRDPAGTYALLLHVPLDADLPYPAAGVANIPAGFYVYVDNAFQDPGLTERIRWHVQSPGTFGGDIAALQTVASLEEIWVGLGPQNREVAWVELLLAIPGATSPIDGFGPPPPDLETRLVYFDLRPELEDFQIGVRRLFPNDLVIRAYERPDESSSAARV